MEAGTMTVGVSAPERSLVQRREALRRANAVRVYRARVVKPGLRSGRMSIADVLADDGCETMKVFDVLLALPKVGRIKANRILNTGRMSPSKTCGGLSERQARELLALAPRVGGSQSGFVSRRGLL